MSETLSLTVTGMKCAGCEATVKSKLQPVAGVLSVTANHKENTVKLEFAPEKITRAKINEIITTAGFQVQ